MPRVFGASFIAQLAKLADPLLPAPRPHWTAVFHFASPVGDLYFSTGKTITVGANTYYGLLTQTGDLSSLIDRREPLRLDIRAADIELDNLPGEEDTPTEAQRVSSYFHADLESTQIELGLAFDLGAGSFVQEILFQGIAQADTAYGYRTAKLQLVSYLEKYLGVLALRILSDEDFPYIRSADNGKGEPIVIGNVRRAPGRVVKARAWTTPQADPANITGQALTQVEVGPGAVSETITITFPGPLDHFYTVQGTVTGAMADGSTIAEYAWPTDPILAVNSRGRCALYISADFWTGVPAIGNVFTFDIDVSVISEVHFSESPAPTPIAALHQLYWNDYAIYDGEGVSQLDQTGILANVGKKDDTSSTSKTSFDAPVLAIEELHYDPTQTGMMAGKYEYVQTYVVHDPTVPGGFAESQPSNAADIELKAEPLPAPANSPEIAIGTAANNAVDKGTHRWAYAYVSEFGEGPLGAPSGQITVNQDEIPDPETEPYLTYEGSGQLFLNGTESARAYCYTWINAYGGETKPSPARAVQVLEIPGALYGIALGIHPPSPIPPGAVAAKIYRTRYTGTTGDFTQLDETGAYHFLGQTGFDGWFRDNGATGPVGAEPPTENTTGRSAAVHLSAIQPGPEGTEKIRIYRTRAGDAGPFHFVSEVSSGTSTFTDVYSDAYITALSASFVPIDPRNGQSPVLPYDTDLSADPTYMAGTVRVELPKVPTPVAPQTIYQVKVYRSKRDKPGTHYFLTTRSPITQDMAISNDVFTDFTPDADLGDGLEQSERPPTGAFGERDHLTGIALRVMHNRAILAKGFGLMVGKVGNPPGPVTINIIGRKNIGQPEGDTVLSATIQEDAITGFQLQQIRFPPVIIPAPWFWIVVDTPDSDPENYYYVALGPSVTNMVRYAKSSLQNKWIPQAGSIVFSVYGAEFYLEPTAIDATGHQVARAIMDVEIPDDVVVSCDTDGLSDDGSGTYTGTAGARITNGADVAHWVGAVLGQIPEPLIDVAGTFAATKAKYGTLFRLSGVIQENMTVLELLLRIGMETRSIPDWSFDKLEWKWLPAGIDPLYTAYKTLTRGDILLESNDPQAQPQVTIERFGMDGVINSIDLKWDRRPWLEVSDPQAYARITSGEDTASVTKYSALTREDLFQFNFIHDEESAIALVAFYLSRYGTPNKALVRLTVVAPFMDVEKDDIVDFDSTGSAYGSGNFGEGPYGGGAGAGILYDGLIPNSIYQVEGKTVRPDLSVELVLREL